MQGREHCHLHEDPAATLDVPLGPFAMKNKPLIVETSAWRFLAKRIGRKPRSPNQQVQVGEQQGWGARAELWKKTDIERQEDQKK